MIELVILLATGLPAAGSAIAPGPEASIAALLDSRGDEPSSRRAVAALEALRPAGDDMDLPVEEALLQARVWLGERHGEAVFTDNVRAGLRVLSRLPPRRAVADASELDALLPELGPEAAGILYWIAVSYAHTLDDEPWYARAGAARRLVRMLERVAELAPRTFHAGAFRVLSQYRDRAPALLDGDDERGLAEARRAVELEPRFAGNLVALARLSIATDRPEAEVREALDRAIALADDALPGAAPEQRRAKEQARALLASRGP